jgi:NAD+ diphosphatase
VSSAFTGARLDRAGDARRRDSGWVAEQRSHPSARAVLVGNEGVVMDGDRLALLPLDEALRDATVGSGRSPAARAESSTAGSDRPSAASARSPAAGVESSAAGSDRSPAADADRSPAAAATEPFLLGLDANGPLFAIDVDAPPAGGDRPPPLISAGPPRGSGAARPEPAEGPRPVPLRAAAAVLAQDEGGLVAYVAALCNWHRRHRFCAACGALSKLAEAGLTRVCPRCGTHHHPRTDPVVIMLVTDGDRALLGRAPTWPERRYSALAGYVEPGESLEEAVAREVAEESGVEVGTPRYVASQPWPFPSSLMLGFEAPWRAGEPSAREDDVEDVRWFGRAEVAAAAAADSEGWGAAPDADASLLLPPRLAIARLLIERWLASA